MKDIQETVRKLNKLSPKQKAVLYEKKVSTPVAKTPVVHKPKVITKSLPQWFIGKWVDSLSISVAEQKIIDELVKYDIRWEREVSFRDCLLPSGAHARYDFLLVDYAIIIEYNGKEWHNSPDRIATDKFKEKYCWANKIEFIVYATPQYYHLAHEISELMDRLGVRRKSI